MPGGTVSSSAEMRSTPRSCKQLAEPVLDPGPVALHLLLGLDLLAPQPVRDLGGLAAQLGAERFRQAVRRVGGDDQRPQTRGRAPRAVQAATDVLPTPPLPV